MRQPTNVMSQTPDVAMAWQAGQPVLVKPADLMAKAIADRPSLLSGLSVTSIGYDAQGRVTSMSNDSGYLASFTYDAQGRVSTITENGVTKTATYNANGSLASFA